MKTASITEAKNNLNKLIDGLRRGPVMILDRGRPAARLEAAIAPDAGVAHLVRAGVMADGSGTCRSIPSPALFPSSARASRRWPACSLRRSHPWDPQPAAC